jgi:DNA-binding CsgD family transcriptional regulator
MKNEILRLRDEGKTYNQIKEITGLSKATISYHCKRIGVDGRIDGKGLKNKNVDEINEFYKSHTTKETAKKFNIGISTIKKIVENKNRKLTETERKEYNYDHVKNFRKRNKERAVDHKGGKCEKCGYDKCTSALEFHHLDPEKKDFTLSQNMNMAWDKIKVEIDKCILVCANCHREIHEEI